MKARYIIGLAFIAGMLGAQSDKIIDAARFVVFNADGKATVTATADSVGSGSIAVFDTNGTEVFGVHGRVVGGVGLEAFVTERCDAVRGAMHTRLDTMQGDNAATIVELKERLDAAESTCVELKSRCDAQWWLIDAILREPESIRLKYNTMLVQQRAEKAKRELTAYEKAMLEEMRLAREQSLQIADAQLQEERDREAREYDERMDREIRTINRSNGTPPGLPHP